MSLKQYTSQWKLSKALEAWLSLMSLLLWVNVLLLCGCPKGEVQNNLILEEREIIAWKLGWPLLSKWRTFVDRSCTFYVSRCALWMAPFKKLEQGLEIVSPFELYTNGNWTGCCYVFYLFFKCVLKVIYLFFFLRSRKKARLNFISHPKAVRFKDILFVSVFEFCFFFLNRLVL